MCEGATDTLLDRALTLLKGQVGVARAVAGWAQRACEQTLYGTASTASQPSSQGSQQLDAGQVPSTAPGLTSPLEALSGRPEQVAQTVDQHERPATVADQLAIASYDQLAASQIVARLDTLSADQRSEIGDYERTHRRRRTILHRLAQLETG